MKNTESNLSQPLIEDFVLSETTDSTNTTIITTTKDVWNERLQSAISNYDPSNKIYSRFLNNYGTDSTENLTFSRLDTLAINPQSNLNNILEINSIVRQYINKDDMIGKTYETIESNINTTYKLSNNEYIVGKNKQKTLERANTIIEKFNTNINIKNFLRCAITTTYSEGNYCCCLRQKKDNYIIDFFPLGVVIVSDYSVNGEPYLLIDINELKSRLQKTIIKTKKNKALFFENIEEDIKNNYPKEVYTAYINKERYAKLDIRYSGIIRTGNLNRKYGLTPIFRALKSALMLETFDNTDMVTSKAKAKKIILQLMRKEIMGADGLKKGWDDMSYAHDNLMQAWKQPTVVYTPPPCVEDIKYVEPKTESTNTDLITQYRSREMLALGIAFLSPEKGQTVTTASITVKELIKTINKISEQVAELLNKWYRVVLTDNGIDASYAPTITINSSEELEMEMRKNIADFLFTKLSCSYKTAYESMGIDIDDEKQRRISENEDNLDEVFKVRQTSYTSSGDDAGGRPASDNVNDKQVIDKERNKSS